MYAVALRITNWGNGKHPGSEMLQLCILGSYKEYQIGRSVVIHRKFELSVAKLLHNKENRRKRASQLDYGEQSE